MIKDFSNLFSLLYCFSRRKLPLWYCCFFMKEAHYGDSIYITKMHHNIDQLARLSVITIAFEVQIFNEIILEIMLSNRILVYSNLDPFPHALNILISFVRVSTDLMSVSRKSRQIRMVLLRNICCSIWINLNTCRLNIGVPSTPQPTELSLQNSLIR